MQVTELPSLLNSMGYETWDLQAMFDGRSAWGRAKRLRGIEIENPSE